MSLEPKPSDKFTFGLWTVGWQARDPFGDATRDALDPVRTVNELASRGAYGVTFHDDDLIPFGSNDADRQAHITRFKKALADTVNEVPLHLTNTEYQFLQLLMENPQRIFTRNQILDAIGVLKGIGSNQLVDTHASRLRKKIRESGGPEVISVIRSVGFRLAESPVMGAAS